MYRGLGQDRKGGRCVGAEAKWHRCEENQEKMRGGFGNAFRLQVISGVTIQWHSGQNATGLEY